MELRGKYNRAVIHTEHIDEVTVGQLINLCNQEHFADSNIRIMPDCHAGKGCTIGTTMTITDKVVPNLVGVDIGCGVASITLDSKFDLNKLDEVIRKHVPHGFNVHSRSRENLLKTTFGIDLNEIRCDVNLNRAFVSVGTLGGGNHFIEVDEDSHGNHYLIVHTGSRNLGKQIAEYYQKKAIEYCKEKVNKIEGYKKPTDDLCYLEGELMEDYLHDMNIAQKYAEANRVIILSDIINNYYDKKIYKDLKSCCKDVLDNVIECIHNFIDMDNMILRKGAISAKKNEVVLIPINMRDGIIVGVGKGNPEWNYSAPHGAGRVLSRSKAKQNISMEDFEESMKDVFTTCVCKSTLDEAPQAYKPISDILDYVGDTLDIVEVIKPVYNFKSN